METTVDKKGNKFPIFQKRFHGLRGELSQEEFAKKIGVSRPVIGFYENGDRVPDALTLKKIADKCETSVDWLLGLTNDEQGNADVTAVEKRLGLTPDTQRALREWNDMGNRRYHFKFIIDFINTFLSVDGISAFFKEINDYIESVKYCAFLEKNNADIDFSVHAVLNLKTGVLHDDVDEVRQRRENEIRDDYYKELDNTKYCHYKAWQGFSDFLASYSEFVKDNLDVDGYIDEQNKIDESIKQDNEIMNAFFKRHSRGEASDNGKHSAARK